MPQQLQVSFQLNRPGQPVLISNMGLQASNTSTLTIGYTILGAPSTISLSVEGLSNASGDVHGLMKAFGEHLQFGVAFTVPEYKTPTAKAGRCTDGVRVDPVVKVDDWNESINVPTSVTKAATDYARHRDMSDEERKVEDVKDAAYTKLIDAGVSVEDARKIVFQS